MDANITVMIEIKKTDTNISSFLFNDDILGWALASVAPFFLAISKQYEAFDFKYS